MLERRYQQNRNDICQNVDSYREMLKMRTEILQREYYLENFEVTSAVIQYAENTGYTLYRYVIQAIHNTGDTIKTIYDTSDT